MSTLSVHRSFLVSVMILLVAGSCAPSWKATPVSPRLVAVAGMPASRLQRGYELHQLKCGKCHPFVNPAAHDEVELVEEIMPVMARKANLDKADKEAVLDYLLAARKLR